MGQKVLVAFDDSENAMRAVEHVAKFFNTDARITLFSVLQDTAALCDMQSPELTSYFLSQRSNFCVLEDKKKELIEAALKKAKKTLVDAGFSEGNIDTRTQVKKSGIARDILQEASAGYSMIILGKRGLSGVKEFFLGSVSQKVLQSARNISVMVVT